MLFCLQCLKLVETLRGMQYHDGVLYAGPDEVLVGEIAASQADAEDQDDDEAGSDGDEDDQDNMWDMRENDDEELIREVLQKTSRCIQSPVPFGGIAD